jgi:hypothetical protein
MTRETLALLGGVLILASATLALLAFTLWRNRQEDEAREAGEPAGSEAIAGTPEPEEAPALPMTQAEPTLPRPVAPSLPEEPSAAHRRPEAPAGTAGGEPSPSRLIPVAALLRDEVTGGLVIRVGEREYRSAAEVSVSGDRPRMEYTLAELNRWFGVQASEAPTPKKEEERTAKAPARKLSMVEQINHILDRKLAEEPGGHRGVRLVEGAGGAIRVYLGVDGYDAIDDVPDPEVRHLIREAVSEWENAH